MKSETNPGNPQEVFDENKDRLDDFIAFREFKEEDLPLIKQLELIPKNEIMGFHNFFDPARSKEKLLQEMEALIAHGRLSAQAKEYCTLMAGIVRKYDVYVANHLRSVLEARA